MKDQNVLLFDAIDDDVLAHNEATQARAQIVVAAASYMRMARKKIETFSDGIDEPVGNLDAPALSRDVIPDVTEFGLGFRRKTVRHQRGGDCSEVRRLRPRRFTSSANCRMDSSVTVRPSPRAREASAASTAVRISAR